MQSSSQFSDPLDKLIEEDQARYLKNGYVSYHTWYLSQICALWMDLDGTEYDTDNSPREMAA